MVKKLVIISILQMSKFPSHGFNRNRLRSVPLVSQRVLVLLVVVVEEGLVPQDTVVGANDKLEFQHPEEGIKRHL